MDSEEVVEFERPDNCYCDEDQGAGYTYSDEHGACNFCIQAGYYL